MPPPSPYIPRKVQNPRTLPCKADPVVDFIRDGGPLCREGYGDFVLFEFFYIFL